jgi:hypothetical protein
VLTILGRRVSLLTSNDVRLAIEEYFTYSAARTRAYGIVIKVTASTMSARPFLYFFDDKPTQIMCQEDYGSVL